jgi:cytochrome c553
MLIVVVAPILVLMAAATVYLLVNADTARAVQTTAEAARICKRALAATSKVTCAGCWRAESTRPLGARIPLRDEEPQAR